MYADASHHTIVMHPVEGFLLRLTHALGQLVLCWVLAQPRLQTP